MQLQSNQLLAHFRIVDKLGEGGMGEVYRATDTKLDRDVAIKVLPEAVAAAPERLARFEREAKALAALNHPNVAGIYQVEHVEGIHFLVMELVPGQTVADRIAQSPLPVEEALAIALQIAEALEAAHDRGIIHRDLKPANVMLAPGGQVKVLDFGLAKAMDADPIESAASLATHSPTFTAQMTGIGVLMGTAAYMSPEQARGDVADRRADVWSFGVVLFEMLTGKMVYPGKTISDTLAGVLARDPAWDDLPESTPRPVRRLLRRCLEKEVTERLQAIGEARIAIRNYQADPTAGTADDEASAPAAVAASRRPWLAIAAVPLLLLGAALAWVFKPAPPAPRPRTIEATLAVDGMSLMSGIGSALVLSRDGSQIAYVTGVGTNPSGAIRIRDTHRLEANVPSGTDRGYNVFFSPDGRWLGFFTPTEMMKVAVSGGAPLKLCTVNRSRGADWGEGGSIVFAPSPSSGLMIVSEAGGEPRPLTELADGEVSHRWPQYLPGAKHVLYTAYSTGDRSEGVVHTVELATGKTMVIHRGGTFARYSVSGHLLFWRESTIFAAPFDLKRLELAGMPAPVLQGVAGNGEGGAHFHVADDGTMVYLPGSVTKSVEVPRTLEWYDRSGTRSPLSEVAGQYTAGFSLSLDGKFAAVARWIDGNGDIWVIDLARETPTRLTFDDAVDVEPIWSPDGATIYFSSRRRGTFEMFRKASDGSSEAEVILESDRDQFAEDVSRDGRLILYRREHPDTGDDLWVAALDGSSDPEPFATTEFKEQNPRFSPDGKWIAYQSDESGIREVYIRPYPGPGGKWQVSSGGGEGPMWSPDGKRLFYLGEDGIHEAPVDVVGNALRIGRSTVVTEIAQSAEPLNWVVSPDGEKFGFIHDASGSSDMAGKDNVLVRFTLHWFEELEQMLDGTR